MALVQQVTLWYHVLGQRSYNRVTIPSNETIAALRKKIYAEIRHRAGCDVGQLILTQVDVDLKPIREQITAGEYRTVFNKQSLFPDDRISGVWPETPVHGRLHIFVSLPVGKRSSSSVYSYQFPSKRPRFNHPEHMTPTRVVLNDLWESLWQQQNRGCFDTETVRRDSNPVEGVYVPTTINVLRLSEVLIRIGDIMIREEYREEIVDIERLRTAESPRTGVVIVGHPGIGKTIFLYYILVNRLLEQKPTIFQKDPEVVYFFHAKGVEELNPSMEVDPRLEVYKNTWALVDCNEDVAKPARMLSRPTSPFFIVMASTPRTSRWQDVLKQRGRIALWFMKPFTLSELIQVRQLHDKESVFHESDIQNFFEKYGPSTRACYHNCDAVSIPYYHSVLQWKVKQTRWTSLTEILTCGPGALEIDQVSDCVLLIEPQSDDRTIPRITIVSKTVSQLLWERDSVNRWKNHREIFTILQSEATAKGFCGSLFEPPFHALCTRGAEFQIYPTTCTSKSVNYKCTHEKSKGKEILVLGPQEQFLFSLSKKNKNNSINELLGDHYYRPIAANHPSFDSFIYDPVSRQISAFQIAIAENHDLKPSGVQDLHELGKTLGIKGLSIRIIVVVLEGGEVTLVVEKDLYDRLGLKVYALEVTLNQLYNFE